MKIKNKMGWALLGGFFIAGFLVCSEYTWAQSVSTGTTITVSVGGQDSSSPSHGSGTDSRLQELERKAAERDLYFTQLRDLQKRLDMLSGRSSSSEVTDASDSEYGMLSRLAEKAALADRLARQLEEVRAENTRLIQQREALRQELEDFREKVLGNNQEEKSLEQQCAELRRQNEGLQQTVGDLLMGRFEYYEVKEGDTLQSIAANPMIYGDASRSVWLRQANADRVRSLDRLHKGDVLVVPRFPRTGNYEF